jgi:hypothetical protein
MLILNIGNTLTSSTYFTTDRLKYHISFQGRRQLVKGNLPETMLALVAYGPGDYRLEKEWPVPECGSDDIIIKTEGCGKSLAPIWSSIPGRQMQSSR